MSSDEIFAAQMWTWPGPMMKRDPSGRVIIVNAAFLQLYGGGVENWAGNPITGWPAPQPPGHATRFESRIPQADGTETIYDWMEVSLSDGSALSIARDVSMFAAQAVATPVQPAAPPAQEQQYQASPAEAAPAQAAQQQAAPPAQDPFAQTAPPAQAHAEPPAAAAPPAAEQAPQTAFQSSNDFLPQEPPAEAAAPAPPPTAAAPEPERDFERRALPMEDSGAVLGNNWRDAVIAKAVGVEEDDGAAEASSGSSLTAAAPEKAAPGGAVRILLAEDNAINALLTRTLLEAEGCHVEVVEDGSLAVEAMKNATYDMIFMDMRMPNMDGLEATRKIRAMDHRSKGLPIVALTANAFDDDRNACFDSGMNDFMTKPVSAEELSDMVRIHTSKVEEKMAS